MLITTSFDYSKFTTLQLNCVTNLCVGDALVSELQKSFSQRGVYGASRYPCQFGLACSLLLLRLHAASFIWGQPVCFVVWA